LFVVNEKGILYLKATIPPVQQMLAKFDSDEVRALVEGALMKAPDGFWLSPASSTGKYHPPFDQVVPGGLVNHSLVVIRFAEEGIRRYSEFTDKKYRPDPMWLDAARAAAMLHDVIKNGNSWGRYTVPNHGQLAAEFLTDLDNITSLPQPQRDALIEAVRWHMGRWTKGFQSHLPLSPLELLIQEADYYASRRWIQIGDDLDLINFGCQEGIATTYVAGFPVQRHI